jgi:type IV pilus assembly protein PilM
VFKKRSSSQAAVVGLDLDPGHIAAAEVTVNGSLSLKRGAVAPLRPGVLRDGEVADVPALAEALKTFFAENGLSNRVRLGIANQRIVVRTLDLPPLEDDKALAAAVKVQAPDHIPMPMDEAVIDWQSLGTVQTAAGQPRTRVVVVAVRREMVDRLVAASREAGLKLEGIDLSAFADSPTSPSPTRAAACSRAPPPAASTRWSTRSPSAAA